MAAVAAVTMWSAGNLIVRAVPMPGVQIAFWRVVLAAVVYWLLLRLQGKRLTRQHLSASAAAGAAIAIELALFFVAIKNTTVANATVLAALQPLVVLGFGARRFGEKPTRLVVSSALIAMVGVALVVFGSTALPVWSPFGDALALAAMVFFAAYFILSKAARASVPAFEFQTAVWVVGVVVLAPVAAIDASGLLIPRGTEWAWLALLLAVPGTGHFVMNWAHPRVRISIASLLTLAIPVLSAAGAAVVFSERLQVVQVAGMTVVVAALAYVIRRS